MLDDIRSDKPKHIQLVKMRLEKGAHRLLLLLLVAADFPLLPGDVASET